MKNHKGHIETIAEIHDEIFNQELIIETETETETEKLDSFLNELKSKHSFR